MKKAFFFLLLYSLPGFVRAQDNMDSLKAELSKTGRDSNRLRLYGLISAAYRWTDPDSSIHYAREGLDLIGQAGFPVQRIRLLQFLGEALAGKGNYSKALETQLQALRLAQKKRDTMLTIWSYCGVGSVYFYSKDYPKALEYYLQAKKLASGSGKDILVLNGFVGEAYFHTGQLDSAERYIGRAYEQDRQKKDKHWAIPYYYTAQIREKKADLHAALSFYQTGFAYTTAVLDKIDGYIGMGRIFAKLGRQDSAISYTHSALRLAQERSFSNKVLEASTQLKDLFKAQGRSDSAFKYMEMMLMAKDSLFSQEKVRQMQNLAFNEELRKQEEAAADSRYRNQVRMYLLLVALAVFALVGLLLWRNIRHRKTAYRLLQEQKKEIELRTVQLEQAFADLKTTQAQLVQSEKMASLGELTAGIAHEIQNPLNFVNNFSEVSVELLDELREEIAAGKKEGALTLAGNVGQNLQKIMHHGKRADAIVKSMLEHSRNTRGEKQPVEVNALVEEYLRLAYHGMRAKDNNFHVIMETHYDETIGKVELVPQDIGRVLLNLFNNAFYSVAKKKAMENGSYRPCVTVRTEKRPDGLLIDVKDNGTGIAQNVLHKIYQPFFTTKPTGEGTGLGLSLSYDIITKGHGGELKVKTEENQGAEFTVVLPAKP